jgi:phosphoadenosine phosphosulfate reductase
MEISEDKRIAFQPLEKKVQRSREVILEAEKRFGKENIAVAWTGGKDSTTVLSIVRTIYNGEVPFKVISVDTHEMAKEVYEFRDRLLKEWNLSPIIFTDADEKKAAESKGPVDFNFLKTKALGEGLKGQGIKALLTGIRWDEHPSRSGEKYFSEGEGFVGVSPLLHFMEKDIWNYIKGNNIPYCALYDKGYRSLGCIPGTAASVATSQERGDNAADREKIIENLKELGYF